MDRKDIQEEIKKRFIELFESIKEKYHYTTDTQLSLHIWEKKDAFMELKTGRLKILPDILSFFYQKFPEDINMIWLLTGEESENSEKTESETVALYKALLESKEKIIALQKKECKSELERLETYIQELEEKFK